MSELQKHWAKTKLSSLPPPPEDPSDREEADTLADLPVITEADPPDVDFSDDSSSASSTSSTGTIVPSVPHGLFARPRVPSAPADDAVSWRLSFEEALDLELEDMRMRAYYSGPVEGKPVAVLVHGAGSSGLTFSLLARSLRAVLPKVGILAPDLRGHGESLCRLSSPDLSLDRLSHDITNLLQALRTLKNWPPTQQFLLVGHSAGGAILTHTTATLPPSSLLGLVLLDIVEGTALATLPSMGRFLASRPTSFPSLAAAVAWHVKSGTVRNEEAARCSVPGIVRRGESGRWFWRTDLKGSERWWEGWFTGLSKGFLEVKGGRMLCLAGADRLDTELMIGQMQGKYTLHVFPEAGHFLHEDIPDKIAGVLSDFYKRNDRSQMVLPLKVDEMKKRGMHV